MEPGNNKRMAVLVGCNYPNTENELQGCINDVMSIKELLIERFGFESDHIEVLTDEAGSTMLPTGANIKAALHRMINQAEAGDVLFFHYSGHGTRFPSKKDPSKQDEAIVPCDFNLITDVDFRILVNRIPQGASFTIISDSCHSGGLIDKEKEQIGPHTTKTGLLEKLHLFHHHHIHKHISHESLLAHLASLTNLDVSDVGAHLSALFGSDMTSKFQMDDDEIEQMGRAHPDSGILLSGCQPDETSADLAPSSDAHETFEPHGAFTRAVCTIFKEYPGPLSNKQVVKLARQMLRDEPGVRQHSCLYCSDQNADAPFLWQPDEEH